MTVEKNDGTKVVVSARWVVDASGRQAFLARKRGGVTPITSHPTSSIWVRYRNVKDMDSKMTNSVMRGSFLKNPDLRREFLSLLTDRKE